MSLIILSSNGDTDIEPKALAYFTNTLDRANLGNAKTDGLEKDLGMTGNQFSLLLVLFYVPYALFNVPWTLLAKKYNSARVIPFTILAWGACTMGAAACTNFGGIMATRIIMGAAEAAWYVHLCITSHIRMLALWRLMKLTITQYVYL